MNAAVVVPFLYVLVFVATTCLSLALTPVMIRWSRQNGFLDYPTERKAHAAPMPLLGGFGIFMAFWAVVFAGPISVAALESWLSQQESFWDIIVGALPLVPRLSGIFVGSLVIFFLGALDDRFDMKPWMKLLGQSIAALILIIAGVTVDLAHLQTLLGYSITFIWIIVILNAFNFIDSIDGHCAGIALISCLMFFWITQILNQPAVGLFVIALAGALTGFLPFNLKPARIFLGDNGSLFLGYIMATITLLLTYRTASTTDVTRFIPIFIFGVPIYDMLSVVTVRLFRGIPPWEGDRNHFAHRLSRLGMSERVAVTFSFFVALTLGFVAVLSTQITTFVGSVLICLLFGSVMGVIAFLEYYAALHVQITDALKSQFKRRREDIRNEEDKRF